MILLAHQLRFQLGLQEPKLVRPRQNSRIQDVESGRRLVSANFLILNSIKAMQKQEMQWLSGRCIPRSANGQFEYGTGSPGFVFGPGIVNLILSWIN